MVTIEGQQPPRIVRRRPRASGGGHHGGSWKIAYADFITAMMAFFLVMWLLTLMPKDKLTGLADYFRSPLTSTLEKGRQSNNSQTLIQGGGSDPSEVKGEVRRAAQIAQSLRAENERRDVTRLEGFRQRLDQVIEQTPQLRAFRPQLRVDMTTEGLRIQILDNRNRPMFANGSAEVEPHMRIILRELAPVFNDVPNRISLSGHTDAHSYSSGDRAYSNWELSADRANASRRELVAGGLAEDKVMRVLGMGSSMPLLRDDLYADMNRRISLVLLNLQTQHRIEDENAAASSQPVASSAEQMREQMQELGTALTPADRKAATDAVANDRGGQQ